MHEKGPEDTESKWGKTARSVLIKDDKCTVSSSVFNL